MTDHTVERILAEIGEVAGRIPEKDLEDLAEWIHGADRVYVAGMGRSGLMARAFAMRLMHLGIVTHVVGDTTTPSIESTGMMSM